MEAIKFEVGENYFCGSVCNHETRYEFRVERRTEKSIWIKDRDGKVSRKLIYIHGGVENIDPFGRYSMAPVLSASGKAA